MLDMAVKQREAWLVRNQIHGGAPKCGNNHRILHDAAGGSAVELDKRKYVSVHMQGVIIISAIVKHQSIAASPPEHEFALVRIFLAVDQPMIEPMGSAWHLLKDHVNGFIWRGMRSGLAKDGVVPARLCRGNPLRARLCLIGVLHHEP